VRLAGVVGNTDRLALPVMRADLAKPKSSSLAPLLVSMMLPGLMSRWMIPSRCAFSTADAISIAVLSARSIGSAPFARRAASVSPSRYSMTRNAVP
jgi:hypothetical protein